MPGRCIGAGAVARGAGRERAVGPRVGRLGRRVVLDPVVEIRRSCRLGEGAR